MLSLRDLLRRPSRPLSMLAIIVAVLTAALTLVPAASVAPAFAQAADPMADPMSEPTTDSMAAPMADPMAAPMADPMAAPMAGPMADPMMGWQQLPLIDARTSQPFTLADFAGKTVYVEPMATWCTNCRNQMNVIRDQVRAQVDPERVVFVSLSVETTLAPETLAAYAATHTYDWTFAVMSQELLQGLADQYGRTVTNPPAVPHFLIMADGSTSDLSTGHHSAEKLLEKLSMGGMMMP